MAIRLAALAFLLVWAMLFADRVYYIKMARKIWPLWLVETYWGAAVTSFGKAALLFVVFGLVGGLGYVVIWGTP